MKYLFFKHESFYRYKTTMVQSMHVGGFEDICLINENVSVITKKYKYLSLDGVYFLNSESTFRFFPQCTYKVFHFKRR